MKILIFGGFILIATLITCCFKLFQPTGLLASKKSAGEYVIVTCHSYGDGFGDYASGLFTAMKFRDLGYKVCLLIELREILESKSAEEEVSAFFQVFKPSLSALYQLNESDIFFYANNAQYKSFISRWSNRLFTEEELKRIILNPNNVAAVVKCPYSSGHGKLYDKFSKCPSTEFQELHSETFHKKLYSCRITTWWSRFYPRLGTSKDTCMLPGIYIYDQMRLQTIANDNLNVQTFFQRSVDAFISNNGLFYFSYFGMSRAKVDDGGNAVNYVYLMFEHLKLISIINHKSNSSNPILVAFKNPGNAVCCTLFDNPRIFLDFQTPLSFLKDGKLEVAKNFKLSHPMKIITCEKFKSLLCEKFKIIFESLNLKSEISIIFYDSIPTSEFIWAIDKSQDFVGCTGDDSFSRVISTGKLPLYFSPRHKSGFKCSFDKYLYESNLKIIHNILAHFVNEINFEFSDDIQTLDNIMENIQIDELKKEIVLFKEKIVKDLKSNFSIFDYIVKSLKNQGFSLVPKINTNEPSTELINPNEILKIKFIVPLNEELQNVKLMKDSKSLENSTSRLCGLFRLYFLPKLSTESTESDIKLVNTSVEKCDQILDEQSKEYKSRKLNEKNLFESFEETTKSLIKENFNSFLGLIHIDIEKIFEKIRNEVNIDKIPENMVEYSKECVRKIIAELDGQVQK